MISDQLHLLVLGMSCLILFINLLVIINCISIIYDFKIVIIIIIIIVTITITILLLMLLKFTVKIEDSSMNLLNWFTNPSTCVESNNSCYILLLSD